MSISPSSSSRPTWPRRPRTRAARPVQGRTQWQLTWRRLRSDKVSMIALAVIVIMVVLAIAAPAFAALTHHPVNIGLPGPG